MLKPGSYFGCLDRTGKACGIWYFDGVVAVRTNVPNAEEVEAAHIRPTAGDDALYELAVKLARVAPEMAPYTFQEMELRPGQFYPRMARVVASQVGHQYARHTCHSADGMAGELAAMRGQLVALMQKLVDICQTVHPSPATFSVYGHEIRNLLILACTEVEMHWRGVLEANGSIKSIMNTNDYVRLQNAMRLGEYGISLPYYPWLEEVRPFLGWTSDAPTQSLPWYHAYNAVKHNREGCFNQGTLGHALHAVVACAVMMIAQYGELEAFRWRTEFGFFFNVNSLPEWKLSEAYSEQGEGTSAGTEAVMYPF